MAKINGVEVKAVKNHTDHEGWLIHSGNIYVDGKKIGSWRDNYMSRFPDYDIPDGPVWNDLVGRANHFYEKWNKDTSAYKGDPDILISELIKLNEQEKAFKECLKKGYDSMVIVFGAYGQFSCLYIPGKHDDWRTRFKKYLDKAPEGLIRPEYGKPFPMKYIKGMEDFIIDEKTNTYESTP